MHAIGASLNWGPNPSATPKREDRQVFCAFPEITSTVGPDVNFTDDVAFTKHPPDVLSEKAQVKTRNLTLDLASSVCLFVSEKG
jgi:hypothetical protein